ncbi:hypothetical protein B0H17DRAFT_1133524 [Mycena rosella]|uniref:Uncharacterized protein n=1 Tax=Mycena rosella TaxID=1033263 RepID=A0AAD7DHT2_MYCRO|nr:hypothetical protein B0H17DRAFT_1133524 [Mycena rosella]
MSSYHHQLASPWPEDLQIERLILGIVPEDVRKVGGIPLKNCLRNLFETAARLGFKYGQGYEGPQPAQLELRLKEWRAGEDVRHQQELEAERVWGYDIGWRLCSEVLQAHAQASTNPPSAPPCSLSVAATPVVLASPAPAHLDWAQDAEALLVSPPVHESAAASSTSSVRSIIR